MAKIENQEEVKRIIDRLDRFSKSYDKLHVQYEKGYIDYADVGNAFLFEIENLTETLRKARVIIRTLNQ